jgi:hypothetical protein
MLPGVIQREPKTPGDRASSEPGSRRRRMLWRCGAAGGADQQFRLAHYAGAQVLQAVAPPSAPAGPWCVTATLAKGDALTIQHCPGTGGQVVKKAGPFYEFPTQNLVMDLTGYRTANGTPHDPQQPAALVIVDLQT